MSSKKMNLLVVDDDLDFRWSLAEILETPTVSVQTASNGTSALELIKAVPFDAILSDINMPDMNGLELLFKVREMSLEIPFVFLTGYADKERTIEALRLGATDFLEKPFESKKLSEIVSKALDLGVAMKEIALETEKIYATSLIPPDQKLRLHRMRQSLMTMKMTHQIYGNKEK